MQPGVAALTGLQLQARANDANPARAGVKETPLASDDVLFVTSNVKLQRMHDLAVSMPAGNYLPPVPGDCQPYRRGKIVSLCSWGVLRTLEPHATDQACGAVQGSWPGAVTLRRRVPSCYQAKRCAIQRADAADSVPAGTRHIQPPWRAPHLVHCSFFASVLPRRVSTAAGTQRASD